MSSSVVRAAARALVEHASWPAGLPFRESVGQEPASGVPRPSSTPTWCSLDFDGDTDDAIGIGPSAIVRETGRITFAAFAELGVGDATLLAQVELATAAIRAWPWGASAIFAAALSAPNQISDAGNWLRFDVVLSYERDH